MKKAQSMRDLNGFGRMAYRHWEKYRPKLFAYLKSQGVLFEHLKDAEDQAEAYMLKAQKLGRDYHESLENRKGDVDNTAGRRDYRITDAQRRDRLTA